MFEKLEDLAKNIEIQGKWSAIRDLMLLLQFQINIAGSHRRQGNAKYKAKAKGNNRNQDDQRQYCSQNEKL